MTAVLTSFDLQGIAPGEELLLAPDTVVTPLALEEALRRGITLRARGAQTSAMGGREAVTIAAPWIVASPDDSATGTLDDDGLIRAVTEEVIEYLNGPASQTHEAESGEPGGQGRADRKASSTEFRAPHARIGMEAVAALIDHTLLRPDALCSDIERLCREAVRFRFATVCVNPWHVPLAARLLRGSAVKVCAVVGFPLGATLPQIKIHETEEAIKLGAQEIDVVQNVGALKSGEDEQVEAELRGVIDISHRAGAICKVILETSLLSREEKVRAALLAKRAGADFVKTSTGFASGGATAEDVALLRETVGSEMGIKASGGIRTLAELEAMVRAGATRIGTSSGPKILQEAQSGSEVEAQSSLPHSLDSLDSPAEHAPARE